MSDSGCKPVDPRVRRTRQLLQQALGKLLEKRVFSELSVQEIAEAATLNRATFYDHYTDKFALLECMVAGRFEELLDERGVRYDGTCPTALRAVALGVCDYLAGLPTFDGPQQGQLEPHLESAIIAVVRRTVLHGLRLHPPPPPASPEMMAAAASWAIYGGAQEWVRTPGRPPSQEAAETIMRFAAAILSTGLPAAPFRAE